MEGPGENDISVATARHVDDPGVGIVEQQGLLPTIGVHAAYALTVGNEEFAVGCPGDGHPLDGTREFIARRREFTVNVALIEDGAPKAGAVYAPALGELWFAGARAFFARVAPGAPLPARENWRRLHTRRRPQDGMTALVSRSHLDAETEAFLARENIKARIDAGSSLKFCRLAEGAADIYPRFGPTMEWDTAAGDAVLRGAGGAVLTPEGAPLRYGKAAENYGNGPFIGYGDPSAVTPH